MSEAGGGPFFEKNGLLFLPTNEVVETTKRLADAKPIIQALAQDPNLRGLTTALNYGLLGVRMKQFPLDDLAGTLNMVSDTFDAVIADRPASFSWRAMLNGAPARRASGAGLSRSGRCSTLPRCCRESRHRRDPAGRDRTWTSLRISGDMCG